MSTMVLPPILALMRKFCGFWQTSLPSSPIDWSRCEQSRSTWVHSIDWMAWALRLRDAVTSSALGSGPATRAVSDLGRRKANLSQPASRSSPARPRHNGTRRMASLSRFDLFPAEELEDLFLHGHHLVFGQPRVDHPVLVARA